MTRLSRMLGTSLFFICLLSLGGAILFLTAATQAPQQLPKWAAQAQASLARGDTAAARREFDNALRSNAKDFTTYSAILRVCSDSKSWTLEEEYSERGIRVLNGGDAAQVGQLFASLSEAEMHTEREHPQTGSIAAARSALSLQPDDPIYLNQLGYVLADNGVDLDEAQRLITRALQLLNNGADSADTRTAIAITEDSYGWVLYKQRQYSSAAYSLAQAVSDLPASTPSEILRDMYYHLGAAQYYAGEYASASQSIQIALKIDNKYQAALDIEHRLVSRTGASPKASSAGASKGTSSPAANAGHAPSGGSALPPANVPSNGRHSFNPLPSPL